MEEKGSQLLKISSILMIIGGIVGALSSVLLAVLAGFSKAAMADATVQQSVTDAGLTAEGVTRTLWIAAIISVISAVIEIIAGIQGKKNWNNPAKAKSLLILGTACLVISIISNIIFASGDSTSITTIITGFVIPVLYIIGTLQLKKQA